MLKQFTLDGKSFYLGTPKRLKSKPTHQPRCSKCGHTRNDDSHPDQQGLFRTTVWCMCDCYVPPELKALYDQIYGEGNW